MTTFSPRTPPQFWPDETLERKQPFVRSIFVNGRGKAATFEKGGITSKLTVLAGQYPSWGIYKHVPPPLFGAKDVC